jgi:elongation factor G
MKVRVFDGGFHAVDSDSMSFELCAKQGFREAARKAKPVLLEPIMKIEVITPDQYMGDVTGDLTGVVGCWKEWIVRLVPR